MTALPSLQALAWTPEQEAAGSADVRAGFEFLARRLVGERLVVLQERIYASSQAAATVLEIRRSVLARHGLDDSPVTVVCNSTPTPGPCAGVHILAVRLRPDETVQTVRAGGFGARELRGEGSHALFVADVSASVDAADPLREMLSSAASALGDRGLGMRDVARTWLYVADLLPSYPRLNAARDEVLEAAGVKGPDRWLVEPPASTGIQGVHPSGAPCFADLLAVRRDRGGRPFAPVRPALQGEAWEYGSSFSRGMIIDLAGRRLVTISGTASIDSRGATLHVGDHEAQILETMRNIASLLDTSLVEAPERGLWTLYFKDQVAWEAWQGLERRGAVRRAPSAVAVFGDVCRDDLLFEAEVTIPGQPLPQWGR